MYDLSVSAVRHNGIVEVTINGFLANSYFVANIIGTYPGTIFHIVDPGYAEVFIEEKKRPGTIVCTQSMVPWTVTTSFTDAAHDTVAIMINDEKQVMADIIDEPSEFNVYGISGFAGNIACRIVPVGAFGIADRLFGPASREECEAWMSNNCGSSNGRE